MRAMFAAAISLVLSGYAWAEEEVFVPEVKLSGAGFGLRAWCRLGPFNAGISEASIDKDFLRSVGKNETGLTQQDFRSLCVKAGAAAAVLAKADEEGGFDIYDFYDRMNQKGTPEAAVYLGTEILSDNETEVWLMFGRYNDNTVKVWLNGHLLHTCKVSCPNGSYDTSIRLPVKAGANLLVIKLGKVNRGVSMTARIEPTLSSVARKALTGADRLLKRSIIKPPQPLELGFSNVPESTRFVAQIETYEGAEVRKLVASSRASIGTQGFRAGLYRLVVSGYGEQAEETFYIGTIGEAIAQMQAHVKAAMSGVEDRMAINLATLMARVQAAAKPRERRPNEPPPDAATRERRQIYMERRTVDAMVELADALHLLESKTEAFRNRPGLHLRGFRSRIDDQIQNYQIFIPASYRAGGPGLPLMMVPVTPFDKPGPYLESDFIIRAGKGAEHWTKTAEALGLAILWPGYRVPSYGSPLDLVHVDEALEAVAKDYKIDTTRLYLFGSCGSGLTVSMQALRHPGRYAAIAYQHPVLHRVKNRYDEKEEYRQFPLYQSWLQETDPVSALAATPDLPIWIIHDSINPISGPLSHSVDFLELARAAGNRPMFDRIHPRDIRGDEKFTDKQMRWIVQHRNPHPSDLGVAKEPAHGPLSRVFAERFIVVKGTKGSDAERREAGRWHKDFCDVWQKASHVPCRTVDDVNLTADEEAASNLVLIGNARTNSVWGRLAEQLPVRLSQDSISVGNEAWPGETLALQGWMPHPQVESRKIALVGAADLERAQVGTMELWIDGWFDYAIWSSNKAGKPELHHAGRYATKSNR